MSLANIESEYKLIQSWNLTYSQKIQILYPSSIKELKNIINFCKKKGKTFAIRTGECSYDSKSIALEKNGMIISGVNEELNLVEIIELTDHPWYVAGQFHPELKSRVSKAHPLFREFIKAAVKNLKSNNK